jgi:uncharacterized protein YfkK (UPF0435 family)
MTLSDQISEYIDGSEEIGESLFQKVFLAGVQYGCTNPETMDEPDSLNSDIEKSIDLIKLIQGRESLWNVSDLDIITETLESLRPPILDEDLEDAYRSI